MDGAVISPDRDSKPPRCAPVAVKHEACNGDIVCGNINTCPLRRGGDDNPVHAQEGEGCVDGDLFCVHALVYDNDGVTGHRGVHRLLYGRVVPRDDREGVGVRLDADIGIRRGDGQILPCLPVLTHETFARTCKSTGRIVFNWHLHDKGIGIGG